MKIIVVSDSHGNREVLEDLLQEYQGKVTGIFHCGDSELPSDDPIWKNFTGVVGGNCDFDIGYPKIVAKKLDSEKIFMTHGHLTDVRFGLTRLSYLAEEEQATIALFGHTHEIACEMQRGILFLNPGSILLPRGKYPFQSYAMITTSEDKYQVDYYSPQHQLLDNLSFVFEKEK